MSTELGESVMPQGNFVLRISGYQQTLLNDMLALQKLGHLCDVQLLAKDGKVDAHKVILIASSPYFKRRLKIGPTKEDETVILHDVGVSIVLCVVEYMYTGTLHLHDEIVEPVTNFCEMLQLYEAASLCREFLSGKAKSLETKNSHLSTDDVNEVQDGSESVPAAHITVVKRKTSEHLASNYQVNKKLCKRSLTVMEGQENGKPQTLQNSISKQAEQTNHLTKDENRLIDITPRVPKLSISVGKPATRSSSRVSPYTNKPIRKGRSLKSVTIATEAETALSYNQQSKHKKEHSQHDKVKEKSNRNEKNRKEEKNICLKRNIKHNDDEETSENQDSFEYTLEDEIDQSETINTLQSTTKSNQNTSIDCQTTQTQGKQKKQQYPITCEICQESIPSHKANLEHRKLHNPAPSRGRKKERQENWPCDVCNRVLTSAVRHACHRYSKHGIPYDEKFKLHKCDEKGCTYVTASKHYIQIHKKGRHGNERPHVCEFCGKGFKLSSALVTHLNIHTNQKVFQCPECNLTFNQKGGLDIHIKKHHKGEASWTELCHLCSKKFLQKAELCWHMYKAHGITLPDRYKVYSCDLCNYQTFRKNKLERHMEAHDGTRSWTCEVCSKKFVTKSYLKRHVKYHGEKLFKCTFENCVYACVDQVGLNKHVRLMHTHKNIKPYKCTLCPYKTGLRGNLDKHIRSVHNLDVVTKHTVQLKMKFRDRNSGDLLTRDGQLLHTVESNSSNGLQVLNSHGSEEDLEEQEVQSKQLDMSLAGQSTTESTAYVERKVAEQMVAIGQVQTLSQQGLSEPTVSTTEIATSLLPCNRDFIHGYVYQTPQGAMVHTSQGQVPFNMVSNEVRMSVATGTPGQIGQGDLYNIDPLGYITSKYTDFY